MVDDEDFFLEVLLVTAAKVQDHCHHDLERGIEEPHPHTQVPGEIITHDHI